MMSRCRFLLMLFRRFVISLRRLSGCWRIWRSLLGIWSKRFFLILVLMGSLFICIVSVMSLLLMSMFIVFVFLSLFCRNLNLGVFLLVLVFGVFGLVLSMIGLVLWSMSKVWVVGRVLIVLLLCVFYVGKRLWWLVLWSLVVVSILWSWWC